jgi:hypothetical protein
MIVVVGLPAYAGSADGEGSAAGLAVDIATSIVRAGGVAELAGKIGDDGAGDAVVLSLGRLGVGHAALLRDAAHPTPVLAAAPAAQAADASESADASRAADAAEPDADESTAPGEEPRAQLLPADESERPGLEEADVTLALSYLAGVRVVVLADPLPAAVVAAAAERAAFAGARLIVVVAPGSEAPNLTDEATVLESPAQDDGSFGRVIADFAVGLEAGLDAAAAFGQAVETEGWEAVAD